MARDGHALIQKIQSIAELDESSRQAIRELPMTVSEWDRRCDIVREGENPTRCCLILEGFTSRFKLLADGRRQILAFHVAGDIPDLQSLHLERMDHHLATLTPCKLAFIDHSVLRKLTAENPKVTAVLWRTTLVDAAIHREWTLAVGRLTARERTAHLLCEMLMRLEAVELAALDGYSLPLTQTEMADALGLTNVSINRMLYELRAEGLISIDNKAITVLDWPRLQKAGRFDPSYLHLRREPQIGPKPAK